MTVGACLDLPVAQSTKSRGAFLIIATAITASWIWNAVIESELSSLASPPSAFDIGQTGFSASAFAVYMSKLMLFLILTWSPVYSFIFTRYITYLSILVMLFLILTVLCSVPLLV